MSHYTRVTSPLSYTSSYDLHYLPSPRHIRLIGKWQTNPTANSKLPLSSADRHKDSPLKLDVLVQLSFPLVVCLPPKISSKRQHHRSVLQAPRLLPLVGILPTELGIPSCGCLLPFYAILGYSRPQILVHHQYSIRHWILPAQFGKLQLSTF